VEELADLLWERVLARDPLTARRLGRPVESLPPGGQEAMDRYGRMTSERFFAARMVADTGLNVLGWSLAQAAACLRDSSFMSEPEIASELLRYAVDDPGQALGYHVGHWYLRELRGTQDIRQFHDAVLASGPLPLRLLQAESGRLPSP